MKNTKGVLIITLGIALCLRLVFVFFPSDLRPFSDMQEYHEKACLLLDTGAYGPASRPPLYPFFLASIYRIAGINFTVVRLVQALLGVAVCLLTCSIARRLCGERGGAIAGLIVACYPGLVIYTGLLMSENIFIFLLTASLWMLLRENNGPLLDAAAGITMGLACLTRSILVGFIPVAALWLLWRRRRYGALLFLAGGLLAIAPWSLRNYHCYGRIVPVDTFGGYNFLIGNNPRATGHVDLGVVQKLKGTYWKGARDDADRAAIGYRKGLAFILRHPRRFTAVGVRKIGYLYDLEIRDLSWAYSRNYFGEAALPVLIAVAVVLIASFPLLAGLALCGIFLRADGIPHTRAGWALLLLTILYFTAAHFLTFGESRFHLPLVPVLAIFAARLMAPAVTAPRPASLSRKLVLALLIGLLGLQWSFSLAKNRARLRAVLKSGGNLTELSY